MDKIKSDRNKTIEVTEEDRVVYGMYLDDTRDYVIKENNQGYIQQETTLNKTINCDFYNIDYIADKTIDLLFLDPPYNIDKTFDEYVFKKMQDEDYSDYIIDIIDRTRKWLKDTATIYLCCDWHTLNSAYQGIKQTGLIIRNIITWEREKGRGALKNFKNNAEFIIFATLSDEYKFYVDRLKVKKKVIAPYKVDGQPKDWSETKEGNFRLTSPSNIWTDLTVPYWSMGENTIHPTQKPEKLLAKLILASTDKGDIVLDPFLGSGTTSVVAKKLDRHYIGIEQNRDYCILAEKRLAIANIDKRIQGYEDEVFLDRNMKG